METVVLEDKDGYKGFWDGKKRLRITKDGQEWVFDKNRDMTKSEARQTALAHATSIDMGDNDDEGIGEFEFE